LQISISICVFIVSEEYLRSYHEIDANILALFGPLETTTTTTITTTPAPTTTTEQIDPILADEDGDDDYSDYYDDYTYDLGSESLNWEEQQFKNAMKDKDIFDDDKDDQHDDDDDDEYYNYDDDEYEGDYCPYCVIISPFNNNNNNNNNNGW